MRSGTCGAALIVMKTTIMLIAAGVVAAAGTVAIVRAVRRRRQDIEVQTEDDLFEEPIVVTEEVFVMTEDADEPSTFTL